MPVFDPVALGAEPSAATDPAQPAASEPSTPHQLHARPAPVWRRAGAALVDVAVIGGVVGLFFAVAGAVAGLKGATAQAGGIDAVVEQVHTWQRLLIPGAGLAALLALLYGTVFGVLGRTPGRLLFGLRLVDKSGLPPTPGRALFRAVLSLFSFGLFLGGFWLALFDRRRQTLHDKLSATFVVRPI